MARVPRPFAPLQVATRSGILIRKTCWSDPSDAAYRPIAPDSAIWALVDDPDYDGDTGGRLLQIVLPKPGPSDADREHRRGVRQDHRAKVRAGSVLSGRGRKGLRFFEDDEDRFGLEDPLAALVFLETGIVDVPTKPWESGTAGPVRVSRRDSLPQEVRGHLERLESADGR